MGEQGACSIVEAHATAAQQGTDASGEFLQSERKGEGLIGPGLQAKHTIAVAIGGIEQQQGQGGPMIPQLPAELNASEHGKGGIKDGQMGWGVEQALLEAQRIGFELEQKSLGLQMLLQQIAAANVGIGEQEAISRRQGRESR